MRRLSQQTASTAREIAGGIASAAAAIDVEVGRAEAMQAGDAAGRLGEIAAHLQSMSGTLGDVVPYLGELSTQMDAGMHAVTADILETLGDMQFQDINRQMLEQIDGALDGLGAHCARWQGVLAGAAEAQQPPPLRADVEGWAAGYVMHAQRDGHALGVADTRSAVAPAGRSTADAAVEAAPRAEAPAIELF